MTVVRGNRSHRRLISDPEAAIFGTNGWGTPSEATMDDVLKRQVEEIGALYGERPLLLAEELELWGEFWVNGPHHEAGRAALVEALTLRATHVGSDDPRTIRARERLEKLDEDLETAIRALLDCAEQFLADGDLPEAHASAAAAERLSRPHFGSDTLESRRAAELLEKIARVEEGWVQ